MCGKNLNIVSMCAVSPVVHTSNISSQKKKELFQFPVAVNNSIEVGPLVFLLQMLVITENIMKHPVYYSDGFQASKGYLQARRPGTVDVEMLSKC